MEHNKGGVRDELELCSSDSIDVHIFSFHVNALTFIAKLVEFLAWPFATVLVVLLLRKDIQRLLGLVRRLKAGPVEAEFEREVAELAKETSQALSLGGPAMSSSVASSTEASKLTARKLELVKLAQVSPRAAILEAWRDVEAAALHLVDRRGLFVPEIDRSSSLAAIRAIAKTGTLDSEWVGRYHELRQLRNKAAHESIFDADFQAAVAYIEITSRLRVRLDAAGGSESDHDISTRAS